MKVRLIDSLATTPPLAELFSDESVLQAMLDFEAALARAEARSGTIPVAAAEAIAVSAKAANFDTAALAHASLRAGTPAIPLVKALTEHVRKTNPEAARWFWEQIRDRYVKPYGFDYIWLDETEPDVDPAGDVFSIGSGTRFYNVYPLFHTASVYEGFRRDFGDSRRVMILARAAYLGAQRNGTVFWSSDIMSTWYMLRRAIPAGIPTSCRAPGRSRATNTPIAP